MRWRWPLPGVERELPGQHEHPGSFGAVRRHDVHTGVDLYCPEGSPVCAVESGRVVAIEPFTGPRAESPWWLETLAVLVEGASGVVCYGELQPTPGLAVGAQVEAGAELGRVMRVLRHDKGRPTSMLHLELYAPGTRQPVWWRLGEARPTALLDPTPQLSASEA